MSYYDRQRSHFRRLLDSNRWEDQNGRIYDIDKMGMQHIANCIKLIKDKPGWRDEWLPLLEAEYNSRKIVNK